MDTDTKEFLSILHDFKIFIDDPTIELEDLSDLFYDKIRLFHWWCECSSQMIWLRFTFNKYQDEFSEDTVSFIHAMFFMMEGKKHEDYFTFCNHDERQEKTDEEKYERQEKTE